MDENDIFRETLKNFTFDVAGGGAIEHLADCGYTPQKIHGMLDYPVPYAQVQEAYWKYCLKHKIIVEEKSDLWKRRENVDYVTEYDSYGHKSLRRVVEYEEDDAAVPEPDDFRTVAYDPAVHGTFGSFLKEYCCPGGDQKSAGNAYASCDFGLRLYRAPEEYENFLSPLTEEQRLYMKDILWKRQLVWHQLDQRMMGILVTLYEQSSYHGIILLLHKKEEIFY
jgi:hypothetical protein